MYLFLKSKLLLSIILALRNVTSNLIAKVCDYGFCFIADVIITFFPELVNEQGRYENILKMCPLFRLMQVR